MDWDTSSDPLGSTSSVPLEVSSKRLEKNKDIDFSENSLKILERRYLRKDDSGVVAETVEGMFERIAKTVAEPDRPYRNVEVSEIEFYNLLSTKRFFPNSPTFTGAGTPLGQLAACFVLPISDDLGKDNNGIFSTLRNAALIQQSGGGNGFSFSDLRPKGARVKSSNGVATGPIGFLKVYDQAFGEVAQGGVRRGANMGVLRVDHPDIRDFVKCKGDEGTISNFNLSVALTDRFMEAVKNDDTYDLIEPHTGKVVESPRAREIFELIVEYAYRNGEPGTLFIDTANKDNPVPHLYELKATNPCVTGDTLIYTQNGLKRAVDLAIEGVSCDVVVDGRFKTDTLQEATAVFPTGEKAVYKLKTIEGYELKLTANHKVKTSYGWTKAENLEVGDKVLILNRPGSFGSEGNYDLGSVLGWLVGDGTVNQVRAVLSFFGSEKAELAPSFAKSVSAIVNTSLYSVSSRMQNVGLTHIESRDEVRIQSDRLRLLAEEHGLDVNKLVVPEIVFRGTHEMQVGFLQALFTADGTVNNGGEKGCSIRLTSISYELLQDVQRLLLNFGIASKIYKDRRPVGKRLLPDGKGGLKKYLCQAYHELAISKDNLVRFRDEIGFLSQYKQDRLVKYLSSKTRGPYKERFLATVASLEFVGNEQVYDLTQPTTHSFIANGLVVHNCGEQWLGPYENCCLGSLNLARHLDSEGRLDWTLLAETIELSTRFLDNVVTANKYVPSVPQLRIAAENARRIGLGFMGLADVMYSMGIRYGSSEGQEFAAQMMEFIRFHSMKTSVALAEERGPFLKIRDSIYDPNNLKWQSPKPIKPFERDFGRPSLDWNEIMDGIRKHGIRNAAQTTVAPTGTISTVAGVEGYGCEPVFALAYNRNVYQAAGDAEKLTLTYTSPLFEKALDKAGLDPAVKKGIVDKILESGSCQSVDELSENIKNTFVVSLDITPDEHIHMQAAIQAFVDNSISKTCNFPETATKEDVAKVYMQGWELRCKGLTVYVTGSRQEVVLETKETAKKKDGVELEIPEETSVQAERGYKLSGHTYKVATPQGKAFIVVNENEDGRPFEVFVNVGKAGTDVAALSEALGRLISGWLRASRDASITIKEIIVQLIGIGGAKSVGFGKNRVSSIPDAVAKVLADEFDVRVRSNGSNVVEKDNPEVSVFSHADMCPECGNSSLIQEEGCSKCYLCGYSVC